jgi:23S rRNA (adenine2503-C2)-methyltransferase
METMKKEELFGKTLSELQNIVKDLGLAKYVAAQITDWLYKKDISSIDEMSNLSKKTKALLNENFIYGISKPVSVQKSNDGTKKYLFNTLGDKFIETAYIPETKRNTLCISTQVGCKMACEFCMTGRQKFHGDLKATTIVNQIRSIPEWHKVSNIVYMGMGEPMDNLTEVLKSLEIITSDWGMGISPRRINVSTIGLLPNITEFIQNSDAHLAISLHTPFDEERAKLMPIQKASPIKDVIAELRKYDWSGKRRLSFEYIVFEGLNHSEKHVKELAKILNGLKYRINLIRFHNIPDSPLPSSKIDSMLVFQQQLKDKGIITTIRASRGQDIDAACGLLSTKKLL